MAIVGIGTDIVQVSRINRLIERYPVALAERILHENEFKSFKKHKSKNSFIAKRFAGKEAVAKALGTGIAEGVTFKEIEITNDSKGKPELILHGKTLEIAQNIGVNKNYISLSDEQHYAIAYVILEG